MFVCSIGLGLAEWHYSALTAQRLRIHMSEKSSMPRLARAVEELLLRGRPAFTEVIVFAGSLLDHALFGSDRIQV